MNPIVFEGCFMKGNPGVVVEGFPKRTLLILKAVQRELYFEGCLKESDCF